MDLQEIQGGVEAATQGVNALSKFASTVGELYYIFGGKAREIRKIADANAYASIVTAETENKVAMIKAHGADEVAQFVLAKESRKMQNTLNVVEKAANCFDPDEIVTSESVSQDWANRFFTIVEDISDNDLQDLWANILAGEVKQPKSYSLRTLDLLRNVTSDEAELFLTASKLYVAQDFICTEDSFLSMQDRWILNDAGLIKEEDLVKSWKVEPHNTLELILNEEYLLILHNDNDKTVNCSTNVRKLTKAGIEILSLIKRTTDNNFLIKLVAHLKSKGVSRITKHKIIQYKPCRYKIQGIEL